MAYNALMLASPGDIVKLDFDRGIYDIAHHTYDSFSGLISVRDHGVIIVLARQSAKTPLTYVVTSRYVGWIRTSKYDDVDLIVHSHDDQDTMISEVTE